MFLKCFDNPPGSAPNLVIRNDLGPGYAPVRPSAQLLKEAAWSKMPRADNLSEEGKLHFPSTCSASWQWAGNIHKCEDL